MATHAKPPSPAALRAAEARQKAEQERLAKALRANLLRRKKPSAGKQG
jgi:hypothetical protein